MTNRFRVSSALLRRLEEVGLPPAVLFDRVGLPSHLLNEDKVMVTTDELFAIYRVIAKLSADPAIGLKLGTEERIERYDPIAIAALCTRSLRDGLARMARYKRLTCPEELEIQEDVDECTVRFLWLLAGEEEPELLVDTCFAWVMAIARRGIARPISPKRIEFKRSATNAKLYRDHFGCPVQFNAAHNGLILRTSDLDEPFRTQNADLLAMVAPPLEAELRMQRAREPVAERVKAVLKRMLAGQRPELRNVARELGLSTRTLQRRLTDQSLTFQHLVKEARRELAQHYLLHSSLELTDTAYLLGYEDANSFFRAFHEWEGTTPGEWRASRTFCLSTN
jgi:AraC-like DNA-binding protein